MCNEPMPSGCEQLYVIGFVTSAGGCVMTMPIGCEFLVVGSTGCWRVCTL